LATLPAEDWFYYLVVLLGRDRELYDLARDRYANDPNPEKAPLAMSGMQGRLLRLFMKNECLGYSRCLLGTEPLPYDPPPEIETAALRAVMEWLTRAPIYPPYTTDEERMELREVRLCLRRAVQARLRQLEGDEAAASKAASGDPVGDVAEISTSPLSATDLAKLLRRWGHSGATDNAVEIFLRRYRKQYPDCYQENKDGRRRHEPRILYHLRDVLPHLREHFPILTVD